MNIITGNESTPLPAPVLLEVSPLSEGRPVRSLTGAYLGTEGRSAKRRLTVQWKGLGSGEMSLLTGDEMRVTYPDPVSGTDETKDFLVRSRRASVTRNGPLRGDLKLILEEA